jgi:hypothetical protein
LLTLPFAFKLPQTPRRPLVQLPLLAAARDAVPSERAQFPATPYNVPITQHLRFKFRKSVIYQMRWSARKWSASIALA